MSTSIQPTVSKPELKSCDRLLIEEYKPPDCEMLIVTIVLEKEEHIIILQSRKENKYVRNVKQ